MHRDPGADEHERRPRYRADKRYPAADDFLRRQFTPQHSDFARPSALGQRAQRMKFVMAGGGTGGHVIPALAVAEALKARGHEPVFFGTRAGYEPRLVPPAGFSMEYIEAGGLNRVGLKQIVRTLWQLPVSTIRSWRWMRTNHPAAVFSMGGYVAGPVI